MSRKLLLIAAVMGFFGVALGAFGAHGLQATLAAHGRADTFDTAVLYHLLHAVALIGVAVLAEHQPSKWIYRAGMLMAAGSIIFSGSLYILAIFNLSFMGAIAPIGGVGMLTGWLCLGIAAYNRPNT